MILAGFIRRNPSFVVKHARRMRSTRRAMAKFRRENPTCAVTGSRRRIEIHHRIPVSVRPDLADDPSNMIALTRDVHRGLAHVGRSENYVDNLDEVIALLRIQRTTHAADRQGRG